MTFNISVKKKDAPLAMQLVFAPGTIRFVVGPNGSVKSSLMQLATKKGPPELITRVHAQRGVGLADDKVNLTPSVFKAQDAQTRNFDRADDSRFFDRKVEARLHELLFRLHNTEAERSRRYIDLVDSGEQQKAEAFRQANPPTLSRANRILRAATLACQVKNLSGEFTASHDACDWFSIRELSDGERAALLLICEVLLAHKSSLILVDDPERHLHRSISAPLLTSLFGERYDCAFLVSTHDVDLVLAMPSHSVMLMRDYDAHKQEWDYDEMVGGAALSDDAKRSMLGGRRKIVFTEGKAESLDLPIYGALFPNVPVRAGGTGTEVERAVRGLRATGNDHWLEAYGIVDLDQKNEDGVDLAALNTMGIYALPVHSVESLYYCKESRIAVATYKAKIENKDSSLLLEAAEPAAMANLADIDRKTNLTSYRAVSRMRAVLMKELPTRDDVKKSPGLSIGVTVTSPLADEISKFDYLIKTRQLDAIIQRYKIRESGARQEISRALLCRDNQEYEALVVHLLNEDNSFRDQLRSKFKELTAVLDALPSQKSSDEHS